ncbi:zinc carboxypeptidase [Pseudonocardiaceae bacterium YIM PH 21723]|nr:zinc carboxypeptidase [Pseudonocardiaceae bacterium YIM PH 21723]
MFTFVKRRLALILIPVLLAAPAAAAPQENRYHRYAEVRQAVLDAAASYPVIARAAGIGRSVEGRELSILKLSKDVGVDHRRPEVLINCNQHANEHLTAEECLHLIRRYTTGYGTDPVVTEALDTRVVWIIPMVNPDGAEYDYTSLTPGTWRKNRNGLGVDLNRNWSYQWGCCGGSSPLPIAGDYRGPSPFSEPEIRAVRDFVNSRVVDGKQRITASIDIHTFSELVMWPWGYTKDDVTPARDAEVFQALGSRMAATNGYTPQQSSDLYISDGTMIDWLWATHRIWAMGMEMYPKGDIGGGLAGAFYPPASVIDRETTRNDRAVDLVVSYADCVPRVIGLGC